MPSSEPSAVEDALTHAREALRDGQLERARDILRPALEQHPDSIPIITTLAAVLRRLGPTDESLPILQRASFLAETDFDVLFELGVALRLEGHIWEAIRVHSRLVELNPNDSAALHVLALDHTALGLMDKALPVLEEVVAAEPDEPLYRISLARALVKVGRCVEAVSILDRIVADSPRYVEALLALAEAHQRLLHTRAWTELALQVHDISPDGPRGLVLLSDAFMAQGLLDQAVQAATNAVAVRNSMWEAHVNLGSLHWRRGALDEAETAFQLASKIAPWDGSTVGMLAQFQVETGRGTPKFAELEAAATAIPHARLPFYLGRLYFGTLHDNDKAARFLRLAVDVAPEDLESVRLLAETHIAREEYDQAIGLLERINELSPDLSTVWNALAYARLCVGDTGRASEAYARAIDLGSRSSDVYHGYGIALLEDGRAGQAVANLEQAASLAPGDTAIRQDLERARASAASGDSPPRS